MAENNSFKAGLVYHILAKELQPNVLSETTCARVAKFYGYERDSTVFTAASRWKDDIRVFIARVLQSTEVDWDERMNRRREPLSRAEMLTREIKRLGAGPLLRTRPKK